MRLVHKVIVLTVIFFLYLSFLPISFLGKNFNISNVSTYNPHPNISVTNDSELEAVASSGDGSDSNPYIIENLNITTSTNHGIFITGITKYVIIRGCWIDTGGITGFHGIYINSVYNYVLVEDNYCVNNDKGIYLNYSNSILIQRNTCYGSLSGRGIELNSSSGSEIINNNCSFKSIGIFTDFSENIRIKYNFIGDCGSPLVLRRAHSSLIKVITFLRRAISRVFLGTGVIIQILLRI